MSTNPRPWTYRKTYLAGGSPFVTITDANGQAIGYFTLWPENVEENAKLICEAVNLRDRQVHEVTTFTLTTDGHPAVDEIDDHPADGRFTR